jgi:vacuolar-type H+-ATPase subunit I/STV1
MTTEPINTATPATQEQPAQQSATDGVNSGSSNGAKFTQEHMNAEIGKARKDAREAAIADVLKELGLTSKDDLKSTIAEAQKLKQSQMSEIEKAQAERDAIIKERDALKGQLDQQAAKILERDIQSAVKAAVTALKANDFDAIYLWAEKHHTEALKAVIGEDGKEDAKALEKLLEAVKKDKPAYFTPANTAYTPGSQSNANGRVAPQNQQLQINRRHTAI